MVEGIYLGNRFELPNGIYELVDMKIEHIESNKNFVVGLYFRNVNNPKDNFWEAASVFLSLPHTKLNSN